MPVMPFAVFTCGETYHQRMRYVSLQGHCEYRRDEGIPLHNLPSVYS
jgi:hypothetical protein